MTGARADEGMEVFFARCYPRTRHVAFLLVGDLALAEEIAMDAFVVACGRWRRISLLEHPESYVRRAAVNIAISRGRRRAAERRANARVGAADGQVVAEWDPSVGERAREVIAAVGALPPRQRACVVLHYFEDLSIDETASTLRCSAGTVKSQLSKARQSLGSALGHLDDDRQGERR
jgi:RNA polymerase sigma-70 factor (sigma-E family)